MNVLISFAIGLLFGLGLIISGMSDPRKVLAFLDLGGHWDPSLALVMAAAIVVALPAFRWAGHLSASLLGQPMQLPTARKIDWPLLLGSAIFGVGWGLAGICPGPALVLLGIGTSGSGGMSSSVVFVFAMLAGMVLFSWFDRHLKGETSFSHR